MNGLTDNITGSTKLVRHEDRVMIGPATTEHRLSTLPSVERKLPLSQAGKFGIAAAALLVISGCGFLGETQGPREVIWRSGGDYVRIESQGARAAPNHHPASFSAHEVHTLLGALRIRQREDGGLLFVFDGESRDEPLFSLAELDRIAAPVSRGLAQAGPSQDVTLAVSGFHENQKFGFVGTTETTAARLFHRDGRLNVILGEVHVDQRKRVAPRGHPKGGYVDAIDKRRNQARPGTRTAQADVTWQLASFPGVGYASVGGVRRSDWILLEPELIYTAAQSYDNRVTEPPERKDRGQRPPLDVEERLRRLKDLYDSETITEDVYRQKASEILEPF